MLLNNTHPIWLVTMPTVTLVCARDEKEAERIVIRAIEAAGLEPYLEGEGISVIESEEVALTHVFVPPWRNPNSYTGGE